MVIRYDYTKIPKSRRTKEKESFYLSYPFLIGILVSLFLTLATYRDMGRLMGIVVALILAVGWLVAILIKITSGECKYVREKKQNKRV